MHMANSALSSTLGSPALFFRFERRRVYDSSRETVLCYSGIPSFHSPVAFDSPTLNFHFSLYTQTTWISNLLFRALQSFTSSKLFMKQAFSTRSPRSKMTGLRYVLFLYILVNLCLLIQCACGL